MGSSRRSLRRTRVAVGFALLAATAMASSANAIRPVGSDFRVTTIGTDGDTSTGLTEDLHGVAYNDRRREYLVVFASDDTGQDNDFDIFGQRLTAAGGRIGEEFRISVAETALRSGMNPSVAYNRKRDEYLVVFSSDRVADNAFEIYGQRLSSDGPKVGGEFRISNATDVGATRDAFFPRLGVDPRTGRYLVTFQADAVPGTDNKSEIYGQIVSGGGVALGDDVRVSNTASDADAGRVAGWAEPAYGTKRGDWLVVFQSEGRISDKFEIFAQRISAGGEPVGVDFRISGIGGDEAARDAGSPAVAYGDRKDRFLVVFRANNLPTTDKHEVFARMVSGRGAVLGSDTRLSFTGSDADGERDSDFSDVSYNRIAQEFLVGMNGNFLPDGNRYEISGQRVGAGGRLLDGNFRVSESAEAGPNRSGFFPALAPDGARSRFLAVWTADALPPTDNEYELFGQILASPKCGGRPATITGSSGPDRLKGTAKRDVIAGLGGRDVIKGLGGGDVLCGGGGKDRLIGGKQKDTLIGGKGRDVCIGGPSRDKGRSCERRSSL